MQIQCIDNSGFEDQLSPGRIYNVSNLQGNSVQLADDLGKLRWYGRQKFSEPRCAVCKQRHAA